MNCCRMLNLGGMYCSGHKFVLEAVLRFFKFTRSLIMIQAWTILPYVSQHTLIYIFVTSFDSGQDFLICPFHS